MSAQEENAMHLQDNNRTNNISLADVLKSIYDDKSLSIFQLIADVNSNGEVSIKKLCLSRKQYYSRISAMVKNGLIKRQSGRYFFTALGKVVYCCIMIVKNALNNFYDLKAVEVTEAHNNLSNEEFTKLVDALIDNQQVKEILIKKC
jgi:DNA-binding Lrp family transcriptional regulator